MNMPLPHKIEAGSNHIAVVVGDWYDFLFIMLLVYGVKAGIGLFCNNYFLSVDDIEASASRLV